MKWTRILETLFIAFFAMIAINAIACGTPDYVTVGPYANCTYVTNGINDGAIVNAAWSAVTMNGTVDLIGSIYISNNDPITLTGPKYPGPGNPIDDPNWFKVHDKKLTSSNSARVIKNQPGAVDLIKVDGSGISISNLILDGKQIDQYRGTITQSDSNGIDIIDGVQLQLKNLYITNTGDAGIRIRNTQTSQTGYRQWSDIQIWFCNKGYVSQGAGDLLVDGMVIANPKSYALELSGIAGYNTFTNCHFWQGGNGEGLESERIAYFNACNCMCLIGGFGANKFNNVNFNVFNYYAIYNYRDTSGGWPSHDGGDNVYTNCRFDYPCNPASYSYPLDILTDGNVVTGNKFEDDFHYIWYQVMLNPGAMHNVVVGNQLYAGGANKYGNNAVYNAGGSTNVIASNA